MIYNIMEQVISDTFKKLVLENNDGRIPIKTLCEACEINKNTFYYYFENREDLVKWTYHYEFAQTLRKLYPEKLLVHVPEQFGKHYSEFPYCIKFVKDNNDDLENVLNFGQALYDHFERPRTKYYHIILKSDTENDFRRHVFTLYYQKSREIVGILAEGKRSLNDDLDYLAFQLTMGWFGWLMGNFVLDTVARSSWYPNRKVSDNMTYSVYKYIEDAT